jgi:hypothetical protein
MHTKRVGALLLSAMWLIVARGAIAEPLWDPSRVKPCDRACLVAIIDGYLDAVAKGDAAAVPLEVGARVTENAAQIGVGQGVLWRAKVEPSTFKLYVADPLAGQVAVQTVPMIEGRPALVAIRLKVERRRITEIEQLLDRQIAPEAMELLHAPRPQLQRDVGAAERASRDGLLWAVHSYFGRIAAFADDCVRHENGYQTVNNKTPGRASPSPVIPPAGSPFSVLSMMTCAQQVSTKSFSFITQLRPRRVLILDEQKGLAAAFPLFVMDGTRRVDKPVGLDAPAQPGLGLLANMVTMETFGIRGGKIHEVEVFPFVTLPFGSGDGWTLDSGRLFGK